MHGTCKIKKTLAKARKTRGSKTFLQTFYFTCNHGLTHVIIATRTLVPMFIGSTTAAMKLRTLLNTDCIELDVATMNTRSITRLLQSVAAYEQSYNDNNKAQQIKQ